MKIRTTIAATCAALAISMAAPVSAHFRVQPGSPDTADRLTEGLRDPRITYLGADRTRGMGSGPGLAGVAGCDGRGSFSPVLR